VVTATGATMVYPEHLRLPHWSALWYQLKPEP
jgi:hypothetical protein